VSIKPFFAAAFAILLSQAGPAASLSFVPQGNKLVGTGATGSAYQGKSVALSADGNTAIVGGYQDNTTSGAVWAYTRTNGVWSQQGSKLVGTGGAPGPVYQGVSVALSADGNTAIVGGLYDNSGTGAVWIFTRTAGAWTQQGSKLVGSGAVGAAYQGVSVALSADGNTAIAGGYFDNGSAGAAWVYTRNGAGVWSQQGSKLVGSGAVGAAYQGMSVALSADGNTAMVGGFQDNANVGAAWIFTRSGGVWTQQGSKLVGTGNVGGSYQGVSVALSADGNTAISGGYFDNSSTGAVWIFTRSGGTWSQQGSKLVGTGAVGAANQGIAVALSATGNTAIVGGYFDNANAGAAWVYARQAGVWTQQGSKLVGAGAVNPTYFGYSVALSGDGNTAMVGGSQDNSSTGAAWAFVVAAPKIVTIKDVPNDQGGKVTVRWTASLLDQSPNNPISAYWIWRQVPILSAQAALPSGATLIEDDPAAVASSGRALRSTIQGGQVYYWEYVGSQVAHGFAAYSYTAATTSDSLPGSNPYTLFMVEAQRTSTGEYWSSDPDSGYSVDNLQPAAPSSLTGNYAVGATHLHWANNSEADFAEYRIYRGSDPAFVPSPANLIATQPDTGYADAGVPGSYYKLSAVDVHGNESGYSLLSPAMTTDVGAIPVSFALSRVPNPVMGGRLTVRFSLPNDAWASMELIDVRGRVLARREVGMLGEGYHSIALGEGQSLSSGIYFVRLTQGGKIARQRVTVLE
jgi:hypothetical protein